jgi:hypothetical protein
MNVQFAGLPLNPYRKLKSDFESWAESLSPEVRLRACPSLSEHAPNILGDLKNIERNASEGYVHIALFPCREWKRVAERFRFDCRVALLDMPSNIHEINWRAVEAALASFLDFEKRWCRSILPQNLNHPLLLPPPSFEPASAVRNYWGDCDIYRENERLTAANNTLQAVFSLHRKAAEGSGMWWQDARGKCFRPVPHRHGLTPAERAGAERFRFCFKVPGGFHYDVDHHRSQVFLLYDRFGNAHRVRRANVDPWGSIRK